MTVDVEQLEQEFRRQAEKTEEPELCLYVLHQTLTRMEKENGKC